MALCLAWKSVNISSHHYVRYVLAWCMVTSNCQLWHGVRCRCFHGMFERQTDGHSQHDAIVGSGKTFGAKSAPER